MGGEEAEDRPCVQRLKKRQYASYIFKVYVLQTEAFVDPLAAGISELRWLRSRLLYKNCESLQPQEVFDNTVIDVNRKH